MEVFTLIAAGIAAGASVVAAILTNRNRLRLQQAEQRFTETSRLQPRRLELYAKLVKVLRGHDRSLSFKPPSELGGGTEGQRAAIASLFMDLGTDSTQRLGEARTLVGQVRIVSSPEVVDVAQRCVEELEKLNGRWMGVLLDFTKDEDERNLEAVMVGVVGAQDDLAGEIERFESVIRTEQGIMEVA